MSRGKFHYEKQYFPHLITRLHSYKKSIAYWMLLRNYVTSIVEPFLICDIFLSVNQELFIFTCKAFL